MIKEAIYKNLPHIFQNILVSIFDYQQYSKRHGQKYHRFKSFLKENDFKSRTELTELQNQTLVEFLYYCRDNSPYYNKILVDIDLDRGLDILADIPILPKEKFRSNIPKICTGNKKNMYVAKTGGTTGNSMEVYFEWQDVEQRFSLLDNFRERFGYKFGEKTAWFSGKDILTGKDLKRNRFWKQDMLYNIRYYSTFNINQASLIHYINDIKQYQPKFLVGFPSSIAEIARYGIEHNIDLGYEVKAIFPTAETKVESEARDITKFFGGGVYDQYASSEGACFITECEEGKLHFELLSGVIEVVDEQNKPAKEGRMLITAFHTRGTPLLRYDIEDTMEWSDEKSCACGRNTPIVKAIHGRINDFIYSKERGKCNLGNLSNCVKYVKGVKKFQVIQDSLDKIVVKMECTDKYGGKDEEMFLNELVYRLGDKIEVEFLYVDEIPREKSGKFRIVKNSIKHLVEK